MASSTLTFPNQQELTQSVIHLAPPNELQVGESIASRINLDPVSLYTRGTELYKQKNYEEAITTFNKVLKLSPNFVEAYLNRGATFLALGDYPRAIENFEVALGLKPDFVEAYLNRGASFLELGNYSKALEDFESALKLKPDYVDAWFYKGAVFERQGQYEKHCWLLMRLSNANPPILKVGISEAIRYYI